METKNQDSTVQIAIRYVLIAAVVVFIIWMVTVVGLK